jgi:hypothetical protein
LVFDTIFIAWVPKTSPLWHQPPKRKTLKACRKQIRLALLKELMIITSIVQNWEKMGDLRNSWKNVRNA